MEFHFKTHSLVIVVPVQVDDATEFVSDGLTAGFIFLLAVQQVHRVQVVAPSNASVDDVDSVGSIDVHHVHAGTLFPGMLNPAVVTTNIGVLWVRNEGCSTSKALAIGTCHSVVGWRSRWCVAFFCVTSNRVVRRGGRIGRNSPLTVFFSLSQSKEPADLNRKVKIAGTNIYTIGHLKAM